MGLGSGPGGFETKLSSPYWMKENGGLTFVSLKLGAASSDKWIIYFTSQTHGGDGTVTEGVNSVGLGLRYYLRPQAPSVFFAGSVGHADYQGTVPYKCCFGMDGDVAIEENSPGGLLAVGYEFMKNWELEAGGLIFDSGATKTSIFVVTLNHAWY